MGEDPATQTNALDANVDPVSRTGREHCDRTHRFRELGRFLVGFELSSMTGIRPSGHFGLQSSGI